MVDLSLMNRACVYYLRDLQTLLFCNFFIKNGFYGTIYIFKNYFDTVFSVFSFQLYPIWIPLILLKTKNNKKIIVHAFGTVQKPKITVHRQ